jgi:cation:H+ antiporter
MLLFSVLLTWLIAVISEARKQRNAVDGTRGAQRGRLTIFLCIGGLLLLVAAGRLIVAGATAIAHAFGMNEFIIGAIIVAVGTSTPELATTLVAKMRGHDEVGLGTILGSNILNGLLIVATAASIAPISVDWREVATTLVFGVVAVACTFPTRHGLIERGRGGILLALYLLYVVTLLQW